MNFIYVIIVDRGTRSPLLYNRAPVFFKHFKFKGNHFSQLLALTNIQHSIVGEGATFNNCNKLLSKFKYCLFVLGLVIFFNKMHSMEDSDTFMITLDVQFLNLPTIINLDNLARTPRSA